jgi:hypothetical protein
MKARVGLRVRAGAHRTGLIGRYGDLWKLHVAAPPIDGKANDAIVRFIADLAGVPNSAVRIVTGHSSTTKFVEIDGISPERLERAILDSHGHRRNPGSSPAPES